MEEASILYFNDADGNQIAYEYLDVVELEGAEYILVVPADESVEAVVEIYRIEDGYKEDEEFYMPIDEETYNAVFGIFQERYEGVINFAD